MIYYLTSNHICRNRLLLSYFGENDSHDCGHCDVCLSNEALLTPPDAFGRAQEQIMAMLADHQPHPIDDLHRLPVDLPVLQSALARLIAEQAIVNDDGLLSL